MLGWWRNSVNGAKEIDEIEKILLAELKQRDAVNTGVAEVETFAVADDAAVASAGIRARDGAGEPAAERSVRRVDDAVVKRELQIGEQVARFAGNFAVGESAGDCVVERFERIGNRDDVGDCGKAEERFVRRAENEHVDFVAGGSDVAEQRRRLNYIAEAAELEDEGAGHDRVPFCASLANSPLEDFIGVQSSRRECFR